MIVHPEFRNLSHDLALIKVDRKLEFDGETVAPICLPFTGLFPDLEKVTRSTGWIGLARGPIAVQSWKLLL